MQEYSIQALDQAYMTLINIQKNRHIRRNDPGYIEYITAVRMIRKVLIDNIKANNNEHHRSIPRH